jgi:hypothetical protein
MSQLKDRWYVASLAALVAILLVATLTLATTGSQGDAQVVASPTAAPATPTRVAPAPTPTPDRAAGALDFGRALDLGRISDALSVYRTRYGAYPYTAGAVTAVCAQGSEAACALFAIDPELPVDDGLSPYWYASDGASYTLVAVAALPQPDTSACPATLPAGVSQVMCVRVGGE